MIFVFLHDLGSVRHARTELFYMFLFGELVIALNSRSLKYAFFELRPHKWLVIAVASQVALTAGLLAFPSIRDAFGVNPPTLTDVQNMAAFGVFIFLTMEGIKAYLRRKVWKNGAAA